MSRTATDAELLRAAIDVTRLSDRRFAATVLAVNERSVRAWLAGARPLNPTVRQICRGLVGLTPPARDRLVAILTATE